MVRIVCETKVILDLNLAKDYANYKWPMGVLIVIGFFLIGV